MTLDTLFRRFGLYCVVGASAFFVDYSSFLALVSGASFNPYIANVISISLGIAVSFSLNRKYNYKKTDVVARRATRFIVVALFGMGVSTLLIMAMLAQGVDVRIAKALSMAVVFVLQFVANTLWTFR